MTTKFFSLGVLLMILLCNKGYSQSWNSVGSGVNNSVYSFALDSIAGELIVGGLFTEAGGLQTSAIAKWNGSIWSDVGGGMSSTSATGTFVSCLLFFNGELYAGGKFDSAGGIPAKNIAKWNGSNWEALGDGLNRVVHTLEVFNGELYAGGGFDSSGSTPISMTIAKWDGINWNSVGSGGYLAILSLCAFNGELYAGGSFSTMGGINAYNVAKWNGNYWDTVGTGFNDDVRDLFVYNNELYAGGYFTASMLNPSNFISKFDGVSWQPLAFPNGHISGFASFNNSLFVTGGFSSPSYIAKFDNNTYTPLNSGLGWNGHCLASYNGELYVGGYFSFVDGGLPNTVGIARWLEPTGIIDNYALNNFHVFPNPFSRQLTISLNQFSEFNSPLGFEIRNSIGQICFAINNVQTFPFTINRNELPPGCYALLIYDKNHRLISRTKIIAI